MALRKNTDAAASAPAPAAGGFEEMDDGNTQTATETVEASAPAAAPAAAPAPQTTTLAVKKEGAVVNALRRTTALDELRFEISAEMLESMNFGTFPRIVVSPNCFTDKNVGKVLGDKIQIDVLSWNPVTLVTTGEKDDADANKLVKSSYDGVNLVGGEGLVTDYVRKLKEDGYDNASAKIYTEIYCNVVWTSKHGFVPEEDQKITQISVPPTSSGPWGAFLLMQRMQANKGKDVTTRVTLQADARTKGANTWGVIDFSTKPVV